jgi:hypothetical protein
MKLTAEPATSPIPRSSTSMSRPRVRPEITRSQSTRAARIFSMFLRTITCGRPVVAESWRTYSSGVCVPSPSGSVGGREELGRLRRERHQLAHREGRERRAHRLLRFLLKVAAHQPRVRLADLDERLTRLEVDDLGEVHRAVGPSTAQHRQVQHQ